MEYYFPFIPFKSHLISQFPQINRTRLDEDYFNNNLFYSNKGICQHLCNQMFCNDKNYFEDFYSTATEIKGGEKLKIFISQYYESTQISFDNAKNQFGKQFLHILCKFNISSSTIDTHNHQHNPSEREIQLYKEGGGLNPGHDWLSQIYVTICLLILDLYL